MGERNTDSLWDKAEKYLTVVKQKFRLTYVNESPPPSGYIDLFVYCFRDAKEESEWQGFLPASSNFVKVNGMADLLGKVRQSCSGGKKVRYLRIMGHGHSGGFRVGYEKQSDGWVGRAELFEGGDLSGAKTPLYLDFEKLKEFLDIDKSVVILDHCHVGTRNDVLIRFSNILGGVNVRGFIDSQVWENSEVQYGQGMYRQCAGNQCHVGVEIVIE